MKCDSLTINNQTYTSRKLQLFSKEKTSNKNTPAWEKAIYKFILSWLNNSNTIVQCSSGTTGKSKKLQLLKSSMICSAENTCRYFNLQKGQTAALCLPVDYIAGKMMVVRCIVGGLNLCLVEPAGKPDFSGSDAIDFCAMVPLQVMNVFNNSENLPPIKKLIIGGTEITADMEELLKNQPVEAYATYGMAETCSHIAVRRLNGLDYQMDYHALPGITITIDARDCLTIKTDYLPDTIITNDLVELTSSTSFRWLGRYDNLINSGGIKVVPEELEAHILKKTGYECAVIGLYDRKLGQRVIVVLENRANAVSDPRLPEQLQKLIPVKLLPESIKWIDTFPRNKSFKIERRRITELILLHD